MSAQDKFQYYVAQIDKELSKYPALNKLEAQTQIPKAYSVTAAVGIWVFLIFFNVFAGFLSNFFGWAVPAYFSLKALETPQSGDDQQWLTYWTVFGGFTVLENMIEPSGWFPYYYVFKTIFIIWLILPSTKGAQLVYHKVYKPLLANAKAAAPQAPTPAAAE
ncbi:hypothetical protein BT69DRAFT_1331028 [Atractiella rhizophila]|nr:hypothetical protein BT69DRAFT_1218048 [Atractiella rhizophila]KAH8926786.1 hypothetical protein BT69DRAFT_1331028 [Atractiella rhizophila]